MVRTRTAGILLIVLLAMVNVGSPVATHASAHDQESLSAAVSDRTSKDDSATRPQVAIPLKFVIVTDDNGTNPAATEADVSRQFEMMQNDAAPFGIRFVNATAVFLPDTALRHVDPASIVRGNHGPAGAFPTDPDVVVVYVTTIKTTPTSSTGLVIRKPSEASQRPAIVVDARHFGRPTCGPDEAHPCRCLFHALAGAVATPDAAEVERRQALRGLHRLREVLSTPPEE